MVAFDRGTANTDSKTISVNTFDGQCFVIRERRGSLPSVGSRRKSSISGDGALNKKSMRDKTKDESSSDGLPLVKPLGDSSNKHPCQRPPQIITEGDQFDVDSNSVKNLPSLRSHPSGKRAKSLTSSVKSNRNPRRTVPENDADTHSTGRLGSKTSLAGARTPSKNRITVTDMGDAEVIRTSASGLSRRSSSESSISRVSTPSSISRPGTPTILAGLNCGGMSMANQGRRPISAEAALCGFRPGDWVSTQSGSDCDGPWRDMGRGKVIGASNYQQGMVDVLFESGDTFAIRAKNLTMSDAPTREKRGQHENENSMGVFAVDDVVRFADAHGHGTVVGPGEHPGTLFVKFSGLGVRSVDMKKCIKYEKSHKATSEQEITEVGNARKAKNASIRDTNRLLTSEAKEAAVKDVQRRAQWYKMTMGRDEEDNFVKLDYLRNTRGLGLDRIGTRVRAKQLPWSDFGVGIVRDDFEGSAWVQFDVKGDLWSLDWADVEIVEDQVMLVHSKRKHFDRPLR